jgi:predicted Zn-dependent protease
MLQQAGAAILATAVEDPSDKELALLIYGGATQLGAILPYSREHEYEADYIGMILMSKAGYDPRYAIKFWEKFSKASDNSSLGEWFSTHPIGPHRIAELKKHLPEALRYYRKAKVKRGAGEKLR